MKRYSWEDWCDKCPHRDDCDRSSVECAEFWQGEEDKMIDAKIDEKKLREKGLDT